MKSIQQSLISMLKEHSARKHLSVVVGMIAIAMVLSVVWSLHINGITLASDDPTCGLQEHTHTVDCYDWVVLDGTEKIDSTEATEAVELVDGTEAVESTEATMTTETTESVETAEVIEAAESTGTTESVSSDTEDGTESVTDDSEEGMESLTEDATEDVTEGMTEEETESSQPGDTKVVDGVTYVYELVCGLEEHIHTDECYEEDDSEDAADGAEETSGLENSENAEADENASASNAEGTDSEDGSDETTDDEEVVTSKTTRLAASSSEEEELEEVVEENTEEVTSAVSLMSTYVSGTAVLDATSGTTYYVADEVKLGDVDTTGATDYVIYTKINGSYYILDSDGRLHLVNDINSDGSAISWGNDGNLGFYTWNVTQATTEDESGNTVDVDDTYSVYNSAYGLYLPK